MSNKILFEVFLENGQLVNKARESSGAIENIGSTTEKTSKRGVKSLKFLRIGVLAVTAAITAMAVGVVRLVRNQLNLIDQEAKLAQRYRVSQEAMGGYNHIAGLTGASVERLGKSTQELQKSLAEAERGIGRSSEAFTALGLSVEELQDMEPDQAFYTLAESLQAVESESDRLYLAQQTLGNGARELNGIIADSGHEFRGMAQEAIDLGYTISREAAQSVEQFNDTMFRLSQRNEGLRRQFAAEITPSLNRLAQAFITASSQGSWFQSIVETISNWVARMADNIAEVIELINDMTGATTEQDKELRILNHDLEYYVNLVKEARQAIEEGTPRLNLPGAPPSTWEDDIIYYEKLIKQIESQINEINSLRSRPQPPPIAPIEPIEIEDILDEDEVEEIKKTWQELLDELASQYDTFAWGLTGLSSQWSEVVNMELRNQTQTLQNELQKQLNLLSEHYEERKEQIESLGLAELEQAEYLRAMDEERNRREREEREAMEKEKIKAERKAAKRQKQLSLFETSVNIPTGAFMAWKSAQVLPFPASKIVGAMMAGAALEFGRRKLTAIQEQPLPEYAKGTWSLQTDQIAQVHRKEMIVSAPFAEAVRKGDAVIGAGKGAGDTNIIVQGSIIDRDGFMDGVGQSLREIQSRTGQYYKRSVF